MLEYERIGNSDYERIDISEGIDINIIMKMIKRD